jgi:hypothetical protein
MSLGKRQSLSTKESGRTAEWKARRFPLSPHMKAQRIRYPSEGTIEVGSVENPSGRRGKSSSRTKHWQGNCKEVSSSNGF